VSVTKGKSRSTRKRAENWEKTFEFFGGRRCMICGMQSKLPIYELHHHDQEGKETNISSIMHHSWEKVEKELRKCMLVCANCHRAVHYIERERRATIWNR
jgi:hypothetical protein